MELKTSLPQSGGIGDYLTLPIGFGLEDGALWADRTGETAC
jgi:hypothetical protein